MLLGIAPVATPARDKGANTTPHALPLAMLAKTGAGAGRSGVGVEVSAGGGGCGGFRSALLLPPLPLAPPPPPLLLDEARLAVLA